MWAAAERGGTKCSLAHLLVSYCVLPKGVMGIHKVAIDFHPLPY